MSIAASASLSKSAPPDETGLLPDLLPLPPLFPCCCFAIRSLTSFRLRLRLFVLESTCCEETVPRRFRVGVVGGWIWSCCTCG